MYRIFIYLVTLVSAILLSDAVSLLVSAGPIEIPSVSVASLTGSVATLQGQMVTVTGNVATLQGQIVAQADTNVTTVATTYTPRFVGDVLVGGKGSGTNAVWIAKAGTTNDWVAIKP